MWVFRENIDSQILKQFENKRDIVDRVETRQYEAIDDCNTEKINNFHCTIKVKTRGILLACTNCGIVIGAREIYGAESKTQVAMMYLDLVSTITKMNCKYIYIDLIV